MASRAPLPRPPDPAPPPALTAGLPGWTAPEGRARSLIGVIPGEGIGPEVIGAALEVLEALAPALPAPLELRHGGLIGHAAEAAGTPALSAEVSGFCERLMAEGGALLCGPGGGRFVYELRRRFDLYCKLTPVRPSPALAELGALKAEARRGVDLLVVRENTGGLYLGRWGRSVQEDGTASAWQQVSYRADEVARITRAALDIAARRRGRICLALKPGGVPAISELWSGIFHELGRERGLDCSVLDIDNAAFQLLARAADFDVLLAPNMFADLLADEAALLLGSRGLSFSGNFGPGGRAVYQTGHGAAWDLAGSDRANPLGQILALAMLLRESLGAWAAAAAVEGAVERVLAEGWRTADIDDGRGRILGTRAMASRVAQMARAATEALGREPA